LSLRGLERFRPLKREKELTKQGNGNVSQKLSVTNEEGHGEKERKTLEIIGFRSQPPLLKGEIMLVLSHNKRPIQRDNLVDHVCHSAHPLHIPIFNVAFLL
jgi:hypothetical protein